MRVVRSSFLLAQRRHAVAFRVHAHGAELHQLEPLPALAHAHLAVEHGRTRLQPDAQRDDQHHRPGHQQQRARRDEIELQAAVGVEVGGPHPVDRAQGSEDVVDLHAVSGGAARIRDGRSTAHAAHFGTGTTLT